MGSLSPPYFHESHSPEKPISEMGSAPHWYLIVHVAQTIPISVCLLAKLKKGSLIYQFQISLRRQVAHTHSHNTYFHVSATSSAIWISNKQGKQSEPARGCSTCAAQRRGQIQSCEQQIAWRIYKKKPERERAELLRHYLLCRAAALESINFKGICNWHAHSERKNTRMTCIWFSSRGVVFGCMQRDYLFVYVIDTSCF